MAIPAFIRDLRAAIGNAPLWLAGVTAVVVRPGDDGDEVLLIKRSDNGEWTPVTGIIDPGEEPAVAGAREVLEEASVVARPERLVWVHVLPPMTYDNGDQAQYLDLVFRFSYVSGDPMPGDDECTAAGWFPLDALPEMASDMVDRIHRTLAPGGETRFEA